jgi:hypothetical protein
MDKQIIFDQDREQEGLMYDLERANREGLYESLALRATTRRQSEGWDVSVTPELLDALVNEMELAANLAPGETVALRLDLIYRYDYGKVETT